jgi:hypothetical protein
VGNLLFGLRRYKRNDILIEVGKGHLWKSKQGEKDP